MKRSIAQWANCSPAAIATLSPAAVRSALEDAQADILALSALAKRVAALIPNAPASYQMLASLVGEALQIINTEE